MKIAICSPNENAYSETFIRAHRDLLEGNILFYHSGTLPRYLENRQLITNKFRIKFIYRFIRHLYKLSDYTTHIYNFYDSFKKNRPDVVLAEYGITAVDILPYLQLLKIPMVVHFHGFDASVTEIIEKQNKNYKMVFNYASSIISVSEVMTKRLIGMGCSEKKIIKTCCGPNDLFLNLKPEYKEPTMVSVGRFVEKKAPYFTILAFNEALKKFPDAKLRIAGDGPLLPVCKDLVKYLKIEKNITFLGILSPEEIMDEMKNAMVYIQHSKTAANGDMEGTPVGILEAHAAALPVISTYHAGIPDVVVHGETGFLVNEGDVAEMSRYMVKILESPNTAKQMGEAGRLRIRQHFSMEKHIALLQTTLQEACKKH